MPDDRMGVRTVVWQKGEEPVGGFRFAQPIQRTVHCFATGADEPQYSPPVPGRIMVRSTSGGTG